MYSLVATAYTVLQEQLLVLFALEFGLSSSFVETCTSLIARSIDSPLSSLALRGWWFRRRVRLMLPLLRRNLMSSMRHVLAWNSMSGVIQI